jgi:hypothetical protein
MKYNNAIDRIGLLLNPLFFDKCNIVKHKDPYNRLTLHPAGQFTVLSIHEEWFNPLYDYQAQIVMAIYELVKEGVITFPDTQLTPLFIYQFHKYFFLHIVAAEFFFDCKEENIETDKDMLKPTIDEAKEEGALYQFYDNKEKQLTDTYYSPDKNGSRKSLFISYNKLEKSIKDNNKGSVEELKQNQNPRRLEFKLYSCNSDWLYWDNFKGNYRQIFNRYKNYLAVIYNNYLAGCFKVKGNENLNFNEIVKLAKRDNRIRFKNKGDKLKKSETLKADDLTPEKGLSKIELKKKKQTITDLLEDFSVKKQNIKNAEKMNAEMEKLTEIRYKNGKRE